MLKLVDNETEATNDLLMSLEEVVAMDLEKEDRYVTSNTGKVGCVAQYDFIKCVTIA